MLGKRCQKVFNVVNAVLVISGTCSSNSFAHLNMDTDDLLMYNFVSTISKYSSINSESYLLFHDDKVFNLLNLSAVVNFYHRGKSNFGIHFGAHESQPKFDTISDLRYPFNGKSSLDLYTGIHFAINNSLLHFSGDFSKIFDLDNDSYIKSIVDSIWNRFSIVKPNSIDLLDRTVFSLSAGINFLASNNYFLGPIVGTKVFVNVKNKGGSNRDLETNKNVIQSGLLGIFSPFGNYNDSRFHIRTYAVTESINSFSTFDFDSFIASFKEMHTNIKNKFGKAGIDLILSDDFYSLSLGYGFIRDMTGHNDGSHGIYHTFSFRLELDF